VATFNIILERYATY